MATVCVGRAAARPWTAAHTKHLGPAWPKGTAIPQSPGCLLPADRNLPSLRALFNLHTIQPPPPQSPCTAAASVPTTRSSSVKRGRKAQRLCARTPVGGGPGWPPPTEGGWSGCFWRHFFDGVGSTPRAKAARTTPSQPCLTAAASACLIQAAPRPLHLESSQNALTEVQHQPWGSRA